MTIRDACDAILADGEDDAALQCAFIIVLALRSAVQREPATIEGAAASLLKATEFYNVQDKDDIHRWLDHMGPIADYDFPEDFWSSIAEADYEELELDDDDDDDGEHG